MANLTYRISGPTAPASTTVKTTGLTNADVDGNFKSLDDAKYEKTGGTISGDVVINGNLSVNGSSTTINVNTLNVDDKNIEIGSVLSIAGLVGSITSTATTTTITGIANTGGLIVGMALTKTAGAGVFGTTPVIVSVDSASQITITSASANTIGSVTFTAGGATELTANGGGLTLKGTTDKTILWDNTNANWTSSENLNIATGKAFKINNTSVLSATTLGSGVTASSLTSVGTLANLTVTNTITGSVSGSAGSVPYTGLTGTVTTWNQSTTGNAATATKLATARTVAVTGDIAYTSASFDGSANVTGVATLATVNTNVGTFNNVTVNAKGLVTAASNVAYLTSYTDTNTITRLRGTASGTYTSGDLTLLAGTNVTISQSGSDYTINSSYTDTNTTYDHLAVTATGGALLRLNGSNSVTDDVKFLSDAGTTVSFVDANTIKISSTVVNDAGLTLGIGSAGATATTVTIGTGTGFSANVAAAKTYDIKVGPSLTALATLMTTGGAGFIKRGATADTYSIDTNTYLTSYVNTTYSQSAVTTTGGAFLRLTGSDSTNDDVKFASGTNTSVAYTDANTITISSTDTITRLRGTASGTYTSGDLTLLAGTNVTISQSGANYTINSSFTDTNTTYDVLAVTTTGGALLRLNGSNSVTDDVKFASDGATTVSFVDANTIKISSTDTNTTYSQSAVTTTGGAFLRLTGSDSTTDDVKFLSDGSTTVSYVDANTIKISSPAQTAAANDGILSLSTAAGATGTSVSLAYSIGSHSANTASAGTATVTVGPAVNALATVMANTTNGLVKKTGVDTYSIDTSTYLTSYIDTNTITRLRGTTSGTYTSGDLTLLAGTNTSIVQSGANYTVNAASYDMALHNAGAITLLKTGLGAPTPTIAVNLNTSIAIQRIVAALPTRDEGEVQLRAILNAVDGSGFKYGDFNTSGGAPDNSDSMVILKVIVGLAISATETTRVAALVAAITASAQRASIEKYGWVDSTNTINFGFGNGGGLLFEQADNAATATIAVEYGADASTSCEGNDSRLSDARVHNGTALTATTGTFSGVIAPSTDAGSDLGSTTKRFTNIYAWDGRYSGGMYVDGSITAGGNVTATSDIRVKTNIKKIDNALSKVEQLNGVTYDRTDIETARQTGVIAQEVLKVLPEAVLGSEETTYSVAYGNMMGLMIEAIKELNAKVTDLQNQLANK